jgi:hypothetical protein
MQPVSCKAVEKARAAHAPFRVIGSVPSGRAAASPREALALSLSLATMPKILVTGMSGTGRSSALAELGRLGFRVVDTDVGGWSELVCR